MGAAIDSGGLQSLPAAWGRVAAARRTVEWALADAARLAAASGLGTNCARLLREADALLATQSGDRPELGGIIAAFDAIDAADSPLDRRAAAETARALLESVLSLAVAGAPPHLEGGPQARLIVPRRRRGRGRRSRDGEDSTDERSSDGEGQSGGEPSDGASAPADGPEAADEAATAADSSAQTATSETATSERATSEPGTSAPGVSEDDGAADVSDPDAELMRLVAEAKAASRGRRKDGRRRRARVEPRLPFSHEERGARPLAQVEGLSVDVAERLAAAGIQTVGQLLLSPPEGFDRRPLYRGQEASEGPVTVRGTVRHRCSRLSPGIARREVVLEGKEGLPIIARWIGPPPRGFESWTTGAEIALVGEVTADDTALVLYEAEPVGIDGRGSGWLGRYGVEDLDDTEVRDAVARSLGSVLDVLRDHLPGKLLERHRLLELDEAFRDAHFPANTTGRGRSRLAFEELFLLQLGVGLRGGRAQTPRGVAHRALHGYLGQLGLQHSIELDDGQERAFTEIRRDLIQPRPMTRLLQGDVGAGKSLVSLLTAVMVAENKSQVAFVCPDDLTAERRFLFAENLLRSVGITPLLVNGDVGHAQGDALRRGEADVVFGTDTLLSKKAEWRRLGLVIVEERDRYGTVPPDRLPGRGHRPDLLVMTTSPVPATLAFSVYGGFDVSVVPRSSGARAVPQVFEGDQRDDAYGIVRRQIEQGHQAYVAFPAAPGKDLLGPADARRFADALAGELLPGARIAIYSSAMSRDERFRVFDDFRHRRIDVLVSTTFIEDTPAVANATAMVVEHADKSSLVRLHRLRGHLHHGACCFVLGNGAGDEGRRLVRTASEEHDGYRIAELDLQQRGVEALLGDRATEAPVLRWADPPQDRALLLRARTEAFELLGSDPELRRSQALLPALQDRWGGWLGEDVIPEPSRSRSTRGNRNRRRRRRRRR